MMHLLSLLGFDLLFRCPQSIDELNVGAQSSSPGPALHYESRSYPHSIFSVFSQHRHEYNVMHSRWQVYQMSLAA